MRTAGIELRHFQNIEPVWDTLIDVYAEVRAHRLHDPHYSVERYGERLARHASEPGWEAVVGYDGQEPVGYAYGNTIEQDDRYWQRITSPLPEPLTKIPTLALKEIIVRAPWRKSGTRPRIHDALLSAAHRTARDADGQPARRRGKGPPPVRDLGVPGRRREPTVPRLTGLDGHGAGRPRKRYVT